MPVYPKGHPKYKNASTRKANANAASAESKRRANLNAKTRKNALKASAKSSNHGSHLAKAAAEKFARVQNKNFNSLVKAAMK
jgi:hypothetical protein